MAMAFSAVITVQRFPRRDHAQKPLKIWAFERLPARFERFEGFGFFFGKTAQTNIKIFHKTGQKMLISCGGF